MLPQIIQIMDDNDLILKPMVTWGSPILGPPLLFTSLCTDRSGTCRTAQRGGQFFVFFWGEPG